MRKTFPLQVWQTTGLILGPPLSHAASNRHTVHFTPSRDVNAVNGVLLTRQRLLDPGHPFRTASPSESPYFIRSAEYTDHLRKEGTAKQLNQKPVGTRPGNAPTGGTIRPDCPVTRQPMHHKRPAQTVKCVNIYTNASFLYVRATL